MIINGKKIAEKIYFKLKRRIKKMRRPPGLGIILVGRNLASLKFSSIKEKKCKELGFFFKKIHLDENITEREIIRKIKKLNADKKIDGIILQLPLPKKFNTVKILSTIKNDKDVEGLNPLNFAKLVSGEKTLTVASGAVMETINYHHIKLAGKHIVIINDSYLIGRPLAYLLLDKKATVTICNDYSNLRNHTKIADIIITAVGHPFLIKKAMVKKGVIVFDLGFTLTGGKITGDVDFKRVKEKCKFISPNPGGIGPVTVALLLLNTYKLKRYKKL